MCNIDFSVVLSGAKAWTGTAITKLEYWKRASENFALIRKPVILHLMTKRLLVNCFEHYMQE